MYVNANVYSDAHTVTSTLTTSYGPRTLKTMKMCTKNEIVAHVLAFDSSLIIQLKEIKYIYFVWFVEK